MKKSSLMVMLSVATFIGIAYAEDTAAPAAVPTETSTPTPVVIEAVAAAPVVAPATPAVEDVAVSDNLEFISGEVSALDEAAKSVSIRLYGENEDKASDKILTVTADENTDITDGEQDRELKSLTAGTEVDVEYDPATNKATYIFVY